MEIATSLEFDIEISSVVVAIVVEVVVVIVVEVETVFEPFDAAVGVVEVTKSSTVVSQLLKRKETR